MSVIRIVEGLERSEATGPAAQDAARLGFLEWVFAQPEAVTAQALREAQSEVRACHVTSDAALAFAEVMRQAVPGLQGAGRRGGRQARRLH